LNKRVRVVIATAAVTVGNECRLHVGRIPFLKMSPKIDGQVADEMNAVTSNYQNNKVLRDGKEVWKAIKK
jgi:hypothetical protein